MISIDPPLIYFDLLLIMGAKPTKPEDFLANLESDEALYSGPRVVDYAGGGKPWTISFKCLNQEWWWTADITAKPSDQRWMPVWYHHVEGTGWCQGNSLNQNHLNVMLALWQDPMRYIPFRFRKENDVPQPNTKRHFFHISELCNLETIAKMKSEFTLVSADLSKSFEEDKNAIPQLKSIMMECLPNVLKLGNSPDSLPSSSAASGSKITTVAETSGRHSFKPTDLEKARSTIVQVSNNVMEDFQKGHGELHEIISDPEKGFNSIIDARLLYEAKNKDLTVTKEQLSCKGVQLLDIKLSQIDKGKHNGGIVDLCLRYDEDYAMLAKDEEELKKFGQTALNKISTTTGLPLPILAERGLRGVFMQEGSVELHLIVETGYALAALSGKLSHLIADCVKNPWWKKLIIDVGESIAIGGYVSLCMYLLGAAVISVTPPGWLIALAGGVSALLAFALRRVFCQKKQAH